MTERADVSGVSGVSGAQVAPVGAAGLRRARYGLVFCEVPPRRRSTRARTAAPTPVPATPGPDGPAGRRAHGTYAKAVVEGCRCELCVAARRNYNRRRVQAIARPDEVWLPYVSAEPARAHLRALAKAGVGLKTVAKASGVSTGGLSKIVYGDRRRGRPPSRRVRPETLRRILAVKLTDARGSQRIPAGPTWALLDELLAVGYTRSYLARALGAWSANPALQVGRVRVRASTARAVEELHRRLVALPAPERRSRWSR